MKNCIVTGSTGFIGRHVVKQLLSHGWHVIAVGRSPSPYTADENLTYVELDLHDPISVGAFFKRYQARHLIHLAWEATPGKFWHSTENFRWISASALFLDLFTHHGGEKAVLAGSCAEYKWENTILEENKSPLNPTTYYSASKVAFAMLSDIIGQNINLVWARIFFPYGPDEDKTKLVSYILREISNNRLPEFQNAGRAVDLIHIEDVAIAFEALASTDVTGTVNICSGTALLPHEIALECAKLLGKKELVTALRSASQLTVSETSVYGCNKKLLQAFRPRKLTSLTEGLASYFDK
ncbi:NAD-dependent epimerase/dehydratase family protein [Sneathiella sp.]|uniref:NAD-dependent epimerase/dehydratase family protein n=1 Tax=Sneathiella sp. TaxID=1964365 RepID=UPI003563609E